MCQYSYKKCQESKWACQRNRDLGELIGDMSNRFVKIAYSTLNRYSVSAFIVTVN